MKMLSKSEVVNYLTDIRALRNSSLKSHIDSGALFFRISLDDPQALQSLIWHYFRDSQVLTPGGFLGGKLYTVRQVARYMIDHDITFEALVEGRIEGHYNPDWFKPCLTIVNTFNYEAFDDLVVSLPTNAEQRDCPLGTFRLLDGIHRSLALAYLLETEKISYQRLHCILVLKDRKLPWILK